MSPLSALLFLALVAFASAHFQLVNPTTRFFDDDQEPSAPCGGDNVVSTTRQSFPISNGAIQYNSFHTQSTAAFFFVTGASPDFTTNATRHQISPDTTLNSIGPGQSAVIDLSTIANVTVGSVGTLQVIFNGGDGFLYQCSDVVLTAANATAPVATTPKSAGDKNKAVVAVGAVAALASIMVSLF
ncbi:hypothetical protein HKX48_000563 [Thoreauomyces humboldtii]|nr:hypothetical protein HKX48_000563 [Thoreauomyces humboldtii]